MAWPSSKIPTTGAPVKFEIPRLTGLSDVLPKLFRKERLGINSVSSCMLLSFKDLISCSVMRLKDLGTSRKGSSNFRVFTVRLSNSSSDRSNKASFTSEVLEYAWGKRRNMSREKGRYFGTRIRVNSVFLLGNNKLF